MNGYLPGMEHEERSVALSQWYTPPELARRMAALVDLRGKRVLEPSAGSGNLVKEALVAGAANVQACDIDARNVSTLRRRFLIQEERGDIGLWEPVDFLRLPTADEDTGVRLRFDVALMNPPWDDGEHWNHILHALKFAPVVIALAPLAMLEGQERYSGLWAHCTLDRLAICSSRPAFGPEEGGKMPVACFVLRRGNSWPGEAMTTQVEWWP